MITIKRYLRAGRKTDLRNWRCLIAINVSKAKRRPATVTLADPLRLKMGLSEEREAANG